MDTGAPEGMIIAGFDNASTDKAVLIITFSRYQHDPDPLPAFTWIPAGLDTRAPEGMIIAGLSR